MLGEEEHAVALGEEEHVADAVVVDAAQGLLEVDPPAAVDVAGEAQVFLGNCDDCASAVRSLLLSTWLPVIFLALGTWFYICYQDSYEAKNRTFRFVDGVYLAVVSVTTVGFGDISPLTGGAKLFQVGYIFTGLCFRDQIYAARIRNFYEHVENKLIRRVEGQAVEGRRWWLWKGGCALAELLLIYVIGIIIIFICEADPETKEDSPYLAAISAMTVGYGDDSFKSWPGRLLASAWLPFSTVAVERFIAFVGEACGYTRRRRILSKVVTTQGLEAAGIDAQDTGISRADFICFMLHALGMMDGGCMMDIQAEYNARVAANGGDRFLPFPPVLPLHD